MVLDDVYLLTAGGVIVVMLAAYVYSALTAPKGLFQRPTGHVEVRDLRRLKGR